MSYPILIDVICSEALLAESTVNLAYLIGSIVASEFEGTVTFTGFRTNARAAGAASGPPSRRALAILVDTALSPADIADEYARAVSARVARRVGDVVADYLIEDLSDDGACARSVRTGVRVPMKFPGPVRTRVSIDASGKIHIVVEVGYGERMNTTFASV